jgi:GR25 family glycosyltransferase involved in LPS biosynthesis
MKTYVIHYTKLKERKEFMDFQLAEQQLDHVYINNFNKEDLTPELINVFYEKSAVNYENKIKGLWEEREFKYRELNLPEISCTIKHFEAIKQIANSKDTYGLVLEDDVVFTPSFRSKFEELLTRTPPNWDAIFIGSGCGPAFQNFKLNDEIKSKKINDFCFLVDHPATNCAEAYLIKKEAAQSIRDSVYPFNLISDWELAYQFSKFNHQVYWWYPSLIDQGSKSGMYESTLDLGQR